MACLKCSTNERSRRPHQNQQAARSRWLAGAFSRTGHYLPIFSSNPASRSRRRTSTPSVKILRKSKKASSTSFCSTRRVSRSSSSKQRPKTKAHSLGKNRPASTPSPRTAASSSSQTGTCITSGTSNVATPTSSPRFRHPTRSPATRNSRPILSV